MTTKKKSTLTAINIGINSSHRGKVCELLATVLADQHVLYIKTRNFHWNLVGERFHTLHAFYEEQYDTLALAIDATAERIRMLGGVSPGSMKEFVERASLSEAKSELIHGEQTINALVEDHEACARKLRKDVDLCDGKYGDAGTADFLTELLQKHEQSAWMLRSFLV
jgi:starvation-inducible DNA-binding protein